MEIGSFLITILASDQEKNYHLKTFITPEYITDERSARVVGKETAEAYVEFMGYDLEQVKVTKVS